MTPRRAWLWWAAILGPLWLALALGCYWEPVVRDGWGNLRWHRWSGLSLQNLWTQVQGNYLHGNPRLGQTITLLQYTPGPWHVLGTPLLELAMFALLSTLALGRRPKLRSVDDAVVFATVTALVLACVPVVGQMLFYRPYTGNYLFGLTVQLAFLVPYRLRAEGGVPAAGGAWWRAPAMLALGAAAGLCNEHTPPAIGAAALGAVIGCWRRGDRPRAGMRAWMLVGLVGLGLGWVALLCAPGQSFRYHALAAQASPFDRIADRGAEGDARIILHTLWNVAFALPWVALGLVARRVIGAPAVSRGRRLAVSAGLGAAVLAALTLLGSPKEGDRLAFASCALAAAAVASWVTAQLAPGWSRRACVGLATIAIGFVGLRCAWVLSEVHGENEARIAAILAGPKDGVVTVPAYTQGRSRWFLGEDFGVAGERQYVADTFGLGAIELAPGAATVAPP